MERGRTISWDSCFLAPEDLQTNTKVLHGPLGGSAVVHCHSYTDLLLLQLHMGTTEVPYSTYRGDHHPPLEEISGQQVLRHQGEQPNSDTKPTGLFKGSHQAHNT